jgi:hypothetical protein
VDVVPHKHFTFAKLWLQYARFEIRRLDLATARKLLGTSIGMCPKEKLFKGYIELELEVGYYPLVPPLDPVPHSSLSFFFIILFAFPLDRIEHEVESYIGTVPICCPDFACSEQGSFTSIGSHTKFGHIFSTNFSLPSSPSEPALSISGVFTLKPPLFAISGVRAHLATPHTTCVS